MVGSQLAPKSHRHSPRRWLYARQHTVIPSLRPGLETQNLLGLARQPSPTRVTVNRSPGGCPSTDDPFVVPGKGLRRFRAGESSSTERSQSHKRRKNDKNRSEHREASTARRGTRPALATTVRVLPRALCLDDPKIPDNVLIHEECFRAQGNPQGARKRWMDPGYSLVGSSKCQRESISKTP